MENRIRWKTLHVGDCLTNYNNIIVKSFDNQHLHIVNYAKSINYDNEH